MPAKRKKSCGSRDSKIPAGGVTVEGRHFVYMVLCADGTIYTGYTTDPGRRLVAHNSGRGARYTRGRRPVTIAYLEASGSRSEALVREAELKKLDRKGKLLLTRRYLGRQKQSSR